MTQKKDTSAPRETNTNEIPTGNSKSMRGILWLLLICVVLGGALWAVREQRGTPAPARPVPPEQVTQEEPGAHVPEIEAPALVQPVQSQEVDAALAELAEIQDRAKRVRLALRQDITTLEKQVAALQEQIGSLTRQLDELKAAPAAATAPVAAIDMQANAQMQAQLTALQDRLDTLQNDYAARDARHALRLRLAGSFDALAAKLRNGEPYGAEIREFDKQSAGSGLDEQALDTLAAHAERGAPSLAMLIDSFGEQAELALPASLTAQENPSLGDTMRSRFAHIVQIRRVDVEPTDDTDEAHLARAESELLAGSVEMTLTHLEQLTPETAGYFADWRSQAEAHLDVQRALERLKASLSQGDTQ